MSTPRLLLLKIQLYCHTVQKVLTEKIEEQTVLMQLIALVLNELFIHLLNEYSSQDICVSFCSNSPVNSPGRPEAYNSIWRKQD